MVRANVAVARDTPVCHTFSATLAAQSPPLEMSNLQGRPCGHGRDAGGTRARATIETAGSAFRFVVIWMPSHRGFRMTSFVCRASVGILPDKNFSPQTRVLYPKFWLLTALLQQRVHAGQAGRPLRHQKRTIGHLFPKDEKWEHSSCVLLSHRVSARPALPPAAPKRQGRPGSLP